MAVKEKGLSRSHERECESFEHTVADRVAGSFVRMSPGLGTSGEQSLCIEEAV